MIGALPQSGSCEIRRILRDKADVDSRKVKKSKTPAKENISFAGALCVPHYLLFTVSVLTVTPKETFEMQIFFLLITK